MGKDYVDGYAKGLKDGWDKCREFYFKKDVNEALKILENCDDFPKST